MASDGETVAVRARPSNPDSSQPIRYLVSADESILVGNFEQAIADFIETVVARLRNERIVESELERLWRDVCDERRDPATARLRRYEAALRCDPDEAPPRALAELDSLVAEAGADAVAEVAGAISGENALSLLDQVRAASKNGGGIVARWDHAAQTSKLHSAAEDGAKAPWLRGLEAARALRIAWGLGDAPLKSTQFETLISLKRGTLGSTAKSTPFPVGLAIERDDGVKLLLRSHFPRSRRFEVARLLGDMIGAPQADTWHPATDLRTARQKYQRAFAAELLCPVDGLRTLLGGDHSDDALWSAAEHFDVSELAVKHQIENHIDC
jgi:hypothetical protein